jgi:hypothetical protein
MRAMLAAFGVLLLVPAASPAATIFGSRLNHDPTTRGCTATDACTLMSFIVPTDPNGDPDSSGSPVSGVITKFRVRAYAVDQAGTVTLRVGDISRPNPSDQTTAVATIAGTGPTVPIPLSDDPETPVREFDAHLPIKQGQHLALDPSATVSAVYASSGNKFTYSFEPPLVEGQGPRGSSDVTEELLAQATVEPDADGDGFGDETQDQCPSQAGTQGQCVSTPPPPPPLTLGGAGVSAGKITYTLSRAAKVSLALAKRVAGRKVNGRCVKPTRKNRRKKSCRRYANIKFSFAAAPGAAGTNTLPLPRRNGRRLARGRYRLTITATLDDGTKASATVRFRVT